MKNIYDFNTSAGIYNFNKKLLKHRSSNNADRCIDYMLQGFTDFPADTWREHPSFELIENIGKTLLKPQGYNVRRLKIGEHYQLCIMRKDGQCWYSNFIYSDEYDYVIDYNKKLQRGLKPLTKDELDNLINTANEIIAIYNSFKPDDMDNCPVKTLVLNSINKLIQNNWKVNYIHVENKVQLQIKAYGNYKTWVSEYNY